ncbi:DUF1353 domain-containing protein [Rhizobium ruizarguesonis]
MAYPDDDKIAPTAKSDFFQDTLVTSKRFNSAPPPIVPFADWDYYYLAEVLLWKRSTSKLDLLDQVDVPKGFVTDLASIPRLFWAVLPRQAEYSYPAIVHDYLYWEQTCTRDQADDVLEAAMNDLQVNSLNATAILFAVRKFGHGAWEQNAHRKTGGEKRLLRRFPPDMTTTWETWRKQPNVF